MVLCGKDLSVGKWVKDLRASRLVCKILYARWKGFGSECLSFAVRAFGVDTCRQGSEEQKLVHCCSLNPGFLEFGGIGWNWLELVVLSSVLLMNAC